MAISRILLAWFLLKSAKNHWARHVQEEVEVGE